MQLIFQVLRIQKGQTRWRPQAMSISDEADDIVLGGEGRGGGGTKPGDGECRGKAARSDGVFQEDLSKEVAFEQRPEGREEWVMWTPREEHPRQREQQLQSP